MMMRLPLHSRIPYIHSLYELTVLFVYESSSVLPVEAHESELLTEVQTVCLLHRKNIYFLVVYVELIVFASLL